VKIGEVTIAATDVTAEEYKTLEGYVKSGTMTDAVMAVLVGVMKSRRVAGSGGSGGSDEESKSSKIRKLVAAGMSKGEVAKLLGVRFQFVYNVMEKESRKKK
jgi:hypothetical protein